MKSKTFHAAAAITLALTASANAMAAVYDALGDYIDFGTAQSLTKVTFSLSSTLASSAGNNLTLYIYDKTGDPLIGCVGSADPYGEGCSGSGTTSSWGSSFFDYSFTFASPLSAVQEIVYILSYSNSANLTNPEQLKIQLTTDDPTPNGSVLGQWSGGPITIGQGEIYAENTSSYFPLEFQNPQDSSKIDLTPVAKFDFANGSSYERAANSQGLRCNLSYYNSGSNNLQCEQDVFVGTVPEPATLALLGIGLAGLGYVRRRKAIG